MGTHGPYFDALINTTKVAWHQTLVRMWQLTACDTTTNPHVAACWHAERPIVGQHTEDKAQDGGWTASVCGTAGSVTTAGRRGCSKYVA